MMAAHATMQSRAHSSRAQVGLVSPGPVATPWWEDAARGFRAADAPPPPARDQRVSDTEPMHMKMMNQCA